MSVSVVARGRSLVSACCRSLLSPSRRAYHHSTRVHGHGSHMSDNDPDILQKEKERNLHGNTPESVPGAPGWNPHLASDSEAAIKAERSPESPVEEMQKQTIQVIQELHHSEHSEVASQVGGEGGPEVAPSIRDNVEYHRTVESHQPKP